jgi:hypothetical protein
MSEVYEGNATGIVARQPVEVTLPVDGVDPMNVESVNVALRQVANLLAYLQQSTALLDAINAGDLTLDGQIEAAGAEISGPAIFSDDVAVSGKLKRTAAATARSIIAEYAGDTGTVRAYLFPDGTVEITRNAAWDGTNWVRDLAGDATRIILGTSATTRQTYPAASASPFANTAWVTRLALGEQGYVRFRATTTDAGGANPPHAQAIANELRPKNIAKAWGTMRIDGGLVTIRDGFNVASAAIESGTMLTVDFASAMAAEYAVVANVWDAATGTGAIVSCGQFGAGFVGKFSLNFKAANGDTANISTKTLDVNFCVFGVQNT